MKQQSGETLGDLEPVYHLFMTVNEITLPPAVTCGLPPKKRETLRNANRIKPQEELGTRKCMNPPLPPFPQRKHSELKEPYQMLNKTKTLTTIARQKMAKEKVTK